MNSYTIKLPTFSHFVFVAHSLRIRVPRLTYPPPSPPPKKKIKKKERKEERKKAIDVVTLLQNQFLKLKNSLLELGKYLIEWKDRELKNGEVKMKREIKELFFKSIIVSIDDMEKFEEKEMKKIRPIDKKKCRWF